MKKVALPGTEKHVILEINEDKAVNNSYLGNADIKKQNISR